MRLRTALLTAATVVALAAPAAAQSTNGFYVGGGGGANFIQDVGGSYKPGNFATSDTKFKTGYGLLGALGYGYGNGWRTELEAAYGKSDIKSAPVTSGVSTSGDVAATSVMGNALYDFNVGLPFTPYLGVGLGWMQLKAKFNANGSINNTAVNSGIISGTDNLVGYQLIAGAAVPLMDQLKLTLDYRFRSTFTKPEFSTTSNVRALVPTAQNYESNRPMIHAVMLGLRWEFGAPARPAPAPAPAPTPIAQPVAPPPAPPPAPPAPPPAAQIQRNFLVFFDFNQSNLTPEATRIIGQAATTARQGNVTRITATGHTDTSGTPQYNQRLSEARAAAVRNELVRLGIPANQIATVGRGESELRVRTADGVREPQNRRVEIVLQ